MVAGVHMAISSKVLRPGETACMKMSQQKMRRWRLCHTVGMPRKAMVTKPGREGKAISMCRALSRGGREQKAADGSSHVAFTPFAIDFSSSLRFRVSILSGERGHAVLLCCFDIFSGDV